MKSNLLKNIFVFASFFILVFSFKFFGIKNIVVDCNRYAECSFQLIFLFTFFFFFWFALFKKISWWWLFCFLSWMCGFVGTGIILDAIKNTEFEYAYIFVSFLLICAWFFPLIFAFIKNKNSKKTETLLKKRCLIWLFSFILSGCIVFAFGLFF